VNYASTSFTLRENSTTGKCEVKPVYLAAGGTTIRGHVGPVCILERVSDAAAPLRLARLIKCEVSALLI